MRSQFGKMGCELDAAAFEMHFSLYLQILGQAR